MLKAVVILLAGVFIYAPVFHGGWLYDDNIEVTSNAAIQNPNGLPGIWRGDTGADYLPLKSTVQWVLWQLFGSNPTSFHGTSIGLHLLSAFLFWRLLHRLGMHYAWLGGVLFAAHPIVVESVAWVSELKNTLSLAVLLLAMLAWLTFDERRRGRDYAWALALFAAALLCKASVIMWPVVILLHAWWKRGGISRRDVAASLPFFAVALAAGTATVWLQDARAIRTEIYPLGGFASRLALAGMNIAFYSWKTVFPVGLLPMYPRWRIDPPQAVEFLPGVFLIGLLCWLWTQRRATWGRAVLFGLGFFLVNLLPVLGLFKMSFMRIAWASDHFVYLPCLGIIGLAAAGAGALYDRAGRERRSLLRVAGWASLAVLVIASRLHAEVYSDLETMSRYTAQANPDAWLAHELFATTAFNKNDFDTALVEAKEAVRLRPDVAEAQNILGLTYESKGRLQEGIIHLREAVRLPPGNWIIRQNLAKCLAEAGQYDAAIAEYHILLQNTPQDAILHYDEGACFFRQGRLDEAIDQFRQALTLKPDLPGVRETVALALKKREGESAPPPPTAGP